MLTAGSNACRPSSSSAGARRTTWRNGMMTCARRCCCGCCFWRSRCWRAGCWRLVGHRRARQPARPHPAAERERRHPHHRCRGRGDRGQRCGFCRMLGYAHGDIIGMNVSQWDAYYSEQACGRACHACWRRAGPHLRVGLSAQGWQRAADRDQPCSARGGWRDGAVQFGTRHLGAQVVRGRGPEGSPTSTRWPVCPTAAC